MNLLLLQKKDTDLHSILLASETSRTILRFYRPRRVAGGVLVTSASLGSTLSLISELRWYIRRYVSEVLLEFSENRYCTHALALEVYQRELKLQGAWHYRRLVIIGDDISSIWMEPEKSREDYDIPGTDTVIEVWCSETELPGVEPQANIAPNDDPR